VIHDNPTPRTAATSTPARVFRWLFPLIACLKVFGRLVAPRELYPLDSALGSVLRPHRTTTPTVTRDRAAEIRRIRIAPF
jgi:hypothetical protein